jgi:hypothetical protein
MSSPTPPPGVVREFIAPIARRAHGLKVKSASDSLVFIGFGFLAITAKNYTIGFEAPMAVIVASLTAILKGRVGYRYRRIRAPVLRKFRRGRRRDVAEAVVYACLQTGTFSVIMAFITLCGIPIPGGLLRALAISFATSLVLGKPVGWLANKLAPYLRPFVRAYEAHIAPHLRPFVRAYESLVDRVTALAQPFVRMYESLRHRALTLARKVFA